MDYEFAVIGGGIAGTSVGAALSEFGRVCLLEREAALGYHASGRSAALFEEAYGLPAVIALNKASRAAHFERGHTSPRGLLFVGTHVQADILAKDIADYDLTPLSPQEAADLVPILKPEALAGAGHHADAYDLDTDRMVQDGAKAIRAAGGAVHLGACVTAITAIPGGWRVTAGPQDYTARAIVNAAGAWVDGIARLAGVAPLGFTPLRRSMARIAAPGGVATKGYPMIIGAGESWYAKPDAGALLVSPAEEDPSPPMDAYPDDMVLAEGLARYQEVARPEVTRPIATWAGLRTFSPDRCLVLGPDPETRTFIWCAGQGGYGFQTAPAAAAFLADTVAGRSPALDPTTTQALLPERFS